MSKAITVDQAGRIVLPAELHRRLNLVPGSRLLVDVVAQRIELTPAPAEDAAVMRSAIGRTVLRPTGEARDAAAPTRAERDAQAARSAPRR